jgi:hypothetical protein
VGDDGDVADRSLHCSGVPGGRKKGRESTSFGREMPACRGFSAVLATCQEFP